MVAALIIMTAVFLQSCEKERQRVVKGQIIDDSTKQPVQITTFKLIVVEPEQNVLRSSVDRETPYTFATDENGYFEVLFESTSQGFLVITYPEFDYFRNDKYIWQESVSYKKQLDIDAGVLVAKKQ